MASGDEGTGTVANGSHHVRLTLDARTQFQFLLGEWRLMFRKETILADISAGIAVALVAVPLSLAIANASGVKPEIGLITAVVGGIVVALFGGSRLQVSGPAAAMTFLCYEIITKYGLDGLIAATFIAGIIQILTGLFRLGRIMQFIPRPVVAGFLSGIGLTILSTQLPKVLGYDVRHDEEGGAIGLMMKTLRQISQTDYRSVLVGLTSAGVMIGLPKLTKRLPVPLIAVVSATLLAWGLGWAGGTGGVELLGTLPRAIPVPKIPAIPWFEFNEIIMAALTIAVLASIESLLSAAVVDSMVRGQRVHSDQELVGQGLGNLASSLMGGIPVTGVIARSGTNVQAGAKTRLSTLLHALLILVMMLVLADLVGQIPIAALSGVLIAVAFRMIEIKLLRVLWRGNRPEAAVMLVTTLTIIFTDLIVGVPVGLVAAFLYVVYELSSLKIRSVEPIPADAMAEEGMGCPALQVIEVEGPLFFGSGFHLRNGLGRLSAPNRFVIFDLRMVPMMDVTAAELLEEELDRLHKRDVKVIIAGANPTVRRRIETLKGDFFHQLRACESVSTLEDAFAMVEAQLTPNRLCAACQPLGHCVGLARWHKNGPGPLVGAQDAASSAMRATSQAG